MKKESIVEELKAAHEATIAAKRLTNDAKQQLLKAIANSLEARVEDIIRENKKDLERMDKADPRYDRLLLDKDRILGLSASLIDIANLPDPTGLSISRKELENGLLVEKKTVPLGVVGVIYESRPNVTVDVAALCIRSGNVCVLRGGSDAWYTNSVLVEIIQDALQRQDLNIHIVQLLPTDRAFVSELLSATQYVDIIIPRGSQALIDLVRQQAKVPVIETGAGVCHTYVERSGDLEKAAKIIANAKIQRPSVCNALDTVLVDREVAQDLLGKVAPYFKESSVKIYADETAFSILQELGYPLLALASEEDFGREFLSLQCSIKVVEGFDEALAHIAEHSSKHSECIVSTDTERVNMYMETVDAAAVYTNASTRFTDGAAFGLGAEIGISTQKLHARGPFALEKLVTEKWYVTGDGQIR
ncbi:glutamate-5-semialdehyde dehydrogenase [Sphingobacterium haloxyli]|uniref:Gamma-glutamyl phosphate reductase n=1 Tax=Sphingobacterium haloxyli TaxID=2100533 RepID=A0A2S9IUB7_9SPHI|nr:glutamate-5-semialdehyde dehydrogenase [Sphingobacterium haloxyli]PRD44133.1 glutamate-5-semialdehyde dehydrogenase [Sphingobacterium haloxyli]